MNLAICSLSLIPLRAEKSHRSEMVSQVLFGETFTVLEDNKEWSFVRIQENGYEGWVQNGQFEYINPFQIEKIWKMIDIEQAQIHYPRSSVRLLHGTPIYSSNLERLSIQGAIRSPTLDDFNTEFPRLIAHYLHTPYLWGGRSLYGIDCSGLTQLFYRHFGLLIPRDAWQQAEQGRVVDFVTEIKAGDLGFFDNAEGRITHVGIMIDAETILHASSKVRIDKFDTEGIFNQETNQYTHKFRILKQFF